MEFKASLVAQRVKCQPTTWETQVQSLGWEDPLEKDMATHSSILAWKIPWTEELAGLQSMGSQESDRTEWLNHHHHRHEDWCGLPFPPPGDHILSEPFTTTRLSWVVPHGNGSWLYGITQVPSLGPGCGSWRRVVCMLPRISTPSDSRVKRQNDRGGKKSTEEAEVRRSGEEGCQIGLHWPF